MRYRTCPVARDRLKQREGEGFGGRGERTGKIDTKIKCETEGKRGREQKGRQMR